MIEAFFTDLRHGFRLMRRAPAFSLVIALTLALGIGGNTAIVSLYNTIYLRTLPIPDVDRVLRLLDSVAGADGQRRTSSMVGPHVAEMRRQSDVYQSVVAMFGQDSAMTGRGPAARVEVIYRTAGWHDTLGVVPAVGRDFTADEERRGRDSGVTLISDALWKGTLGGAPLSNLIVHFDGRPYTVVGVMPPGFRFPYEADAWVPQLLDPSDRARDYAVFGRLRQGVTAAQARAAMAVASARIRSAQPDTLPGYAVGVRTLRENLVGEQAGVTFALLFIVGFLLLLACVNVATLLMARAVSRSRELAVRAALGATRAQIVRQVLAETLALAAAGGAGGVLLAAWSAQLTAALLPDNISIQLGVATPAIDLRLMVFAAAMTTIAGLAVGLAPALGSAPASDALGGSRSLRADGGRSRRLLNAFVVSQTALALVLLAAAGVMIATLERLQHRDLGFNADRLLTLEMTPDVSRHPRDVSRALLVRRLQDEIAAVPGISAVGTVTVNPLGGATWIAPIYLEGVGTSPADTFSVNHRLVTPELFAAMEIPIVRGRTFSWSDDAAHPPVVIVSREMAEQFWPGTDPVGKRVRVARAGAPWLTVVGVAGNVHDAGDAGGPQATWYLPYAQNAAVRAADELHLMIRGAADEQTLTASVRDAVRRVDAELPVYHVAEMDRYYADSLQRERLGTLATSAFGLFGLLLAALGVYGVMAFAAAQRMFEMGVRVALGASRGTILSLMLTRAVRLSAAGLAAGAVLAMWANRVLAGWLPGVRPVEPAALAGAAAILLGVSLVASYLPARRAAAVDPLVALRAE